MTQPRRGERFFRPSGAGPLRSGTGAARIGARDSIPTARAVGYNLPPLRGARPSGVQPRPITRRVTSMYRLLTFACLLLLSPLARADGADLLHRDIVYETIDGTPIKLDVAMPKDQGPGPFPLIVAIHGGAWRIGDKSKFTGMIEAMARHGYVAASINYRFAPRYHWPAQLDDATSAVRFLKQHAAEYQIDVDRLGA